MMEELKLFSDNRTKEYITDYHLRDMFYIFMTEECTELTKELCKALRGKIDKERMEEEIADVIISLERFLDKYVEDHGNTDARDIRIKNSFLDRASIVCNSFEADSPKEIIYCLVDMARVSISCNTILDMANIFSVSLIVDRLIEGICTTIDRYELSIENIKANYTSTIDKILSGKK